MYQGKSETRPVDIPASMYPIYRLLGTEKFTNRDHTLATDNWFTSVGVALLCISKNINFVGTIRTNKKHIPTNLIFKKTGSGKHERFDRKVAVGTTSDGNQLFFTSYQDTSPTHFLSTYLPTIRPALKRFYDNGTVVIPIYQSASSCR